jgi:hypothetical protein
VPRTRPLWLLLVGVVLLSCCVCRSAPPSVSIKGGSVPVIVVPTPDSPTGDSDIVFSSAPSVVS